MVQAGAVGGVADVHARALAHRFQAFEDLDAALAVAIHGLGRVLGVFGVSLMAAFEMRFAL